MGGRLVAWGYWAFIPVLVFAGGAVYFGFTEGAWYDEASTMATTEHAFGETIGRCYRQETQPPLYFLLLNAWLRLYRSIGFARLFSVVFAVAGTWLTVAGFRRVNGSAPAHTALLAPVVLFAIPYTMYAATEARSYALQLAVGALVAWFMASALERGRAAPKEVAGIACAGVALAYMNYAAAGIALAATVALLAYRMLSLRQALVIAAVGIASSAPLLPWVVHHFTLHAEPSSGPKLQGALAVFDRLSNVVVPHAVQRGAWQRVLVGVLGGAVLISLLVKAGRGERVPTFAKAFGLCAGIFVGLFVGIGLAGGEQVVVERYLSAGIPVLWIATLSLLGRSLGWGPTAAILLVLSAGGVYRVVKLHGSGIRQGDWRNVAARIEEHPLGPRRVFVYPPTDALVLRVETKVPARVQAFPHDYDGSAFVPLADYDLQDQRPLALEIARQVGPEPFWFAYADPPIAPRHHKDPLAVPLAFLSQHCDIKERYDHQGSRLFLVTLKR